jgi:hypothetical protein
MAYVQLRSEHNFVEFVKPARSRSIPMSQAYQQEFESQLGQQSQFSAADTLKYKAEMQADMVGALVVLLFHLNFNRLICVLFGVDGESETARCMQKQQASSSTSSVSSSSASSQVCFWDLLPLQFPFALISRHSRC